MRGTTTATPEAQCHDCARWVPADTISTVDEGGDHDLCVDCYIERYDEEPDLSFP